MPIANRIRSLRLVTPGEAALSRLRTNQHLRHNRKPAPDFKHAGCASPPV